MDPIPAAVHMTDQNSTEPKGLPRSQFQQLLEASEAATDTTIASLIEQAKKHSEAAIEAHRHSPLVNHRLATAIYQACEAVSADWDSYSENAQYWLRGAMYYFASADDDEHDFASPIGFEDDAEVLNACLKLVNRNDLKINPEEYDDV